MKSFFIFSYFIFLVVTFSAQWRSTEERNIICTNGRGWSHLFGAVSSLYTFVVLVLHPGWVNHLPAIVSLGMADLGYFCGNVYSYMRAYDVSSHRLSSFSFFCCRSRSSWIVSSLHSENWLSKEFFVDRGRRKTTSANYTHWCLPCILSICT